VQVAVALIVIKFLTGTHSQMVSVPRSRGNGLLEHSHWHPVLRAELAVSLPMFGFRLDLSGRAEPIIAR
jgi:hypothetical protein